MHLAILSAGLIALLAPAGAVADVYKWTDERGVTVISSAPPDETAPVRHLEVVGRETKRAKNSSAAATYEERASTEQMLLDRIESLERELRAQQGSRETVPARPASQVAYYTTPYQGNYYATPPAPPHWDSPPAFYGYSWPYVGFYPGVTVFHRSQGHFRPKHFPHASTHGKFSRGFAHSGVPRTGSFNRGRR